MEKDQAAKRVVIAEDQTGMRGLVRELIDEETDLQVVGLAATGEEVLERVTKERPDAVVLDLGLPVLDGELVLGWLTGSDERPRIVVLSGQASALIAPRLIEAGADAVVEKGVRGWERELLAQLRGG